MLIRLILIVFFIVACAPVNTRADALADVLEQMIATYGGEKNLQKLDSMVQEWDLLALMRNQQGTDKRSIRLAGQLRVELIYPDKLETRVLDGETAFAVFGDGDPAPASNMQKGAMRLQLMRFYSPLTLRERIDSLSLSQGDGHVVLSLTEGALQTDYVVSTETWHIVKTVGRLAINGAAMQFVTEYSEFSMVDGVLVPHRENKFVGGMNTAVLRLKRIDLDAHLDDDEFAPRKNRIDPINAYWRPGPAESRTVAPEGVTGVATAWINFGG